MARAPQPRSTRTPLKSGGPRSVSAGRCCIGLGGLGLCVGHSGEGSKKQGSAPHWLLSGIKGDSRVSIFGLLFSEGAAGSQATPGAGGRSLVWPSLPGRVFWQECAVGMPVGWPDTVSSVGRCAVGLGQLRVLEAGHSLHLSASGGSALWDGMRVTSLSSVTSDVH